FKTISTEFGLHKLAVCNSTHGGDIETCLLCDVFKDHRAQTGFITCYEEVVLMIHDGGHRTKQRMLALLDGIDEPFGRINLLFDEEYGFLLSPVLFRAAVI